MGEPHPHKDAFGRTWTNGGNNPDEEVGTMISPMPAKPHTWVRLTYVPLIVSQKIDGSALIVRSSSSARAVALDEAKDGCWFCHTPLNNETIYTECVPEAADE